MIVFLLLRFLRLLLLCQSLLLLGLLINYYKLFSRTRERRGKRKKDKGEHSSRSGLTSNAVVSSFPHAVKERGKPRLAFLPSWFLVVVVFHWRHCSVHSIHWLTHSFTHWLSVWGCLDEPIAPYYWRLEWRRLEHTFLPSLSLFSSNCRRSLFVCVHCTALHFPDSRSSVWIFFINQLWLPSSSVHSCCCCKAKGARAIYLISSLLFLVAVVKESEWAKNLPYARHRCCCGFVSVTKLLLLLFCSSLVGRSVIIVRWCLIFYVSLELKQQQLSGSQLSS